MGRELKCKNKEDLTKTKQTQIKNTINEHETNIDSDHKNINKELG